ncbi:hypothetical protein E27107_300051 [Elizabethkingia anophelis]|nr:hypothetical protein E18064_60098 [Elizabethkingia anophelis]CDN78458.1 hypothetical protein E27107_300051 [Elizabethkingia anophelis]
MYPRLFHTIHSLKSEIDTSPENTKNTKTLHLELIAMHENKYKMMKKTTTLKFTCSFIR